jgi:hypothetical protein
MAPAGREDSIGGDALMVSWVSGRAEAMNRLIAALMQSLPQEKPVCLQNPGLLAFLGRQAVCLNAPSV